MFRFLLVVVVVVSSVNTGDAKTRSGRDTDEKAMGSNPARITWDSSRDIGVYRRIGGENMLLSLTDNV